LVSYLSTARAIVLALAILAAALISVALLERAPYEKQVKKTEGTA
jgi:hypothetical protein